MAEQQLVPWIHGPDFVCPITHIHIPVNAFAKIIDIAAVAADAVLEIYKSYDGDFVQKPDMSPLTNADIAAHDIIVSNLGALTPAIPVISEEGFDIPDLSRRMHFLVDPLDGTKEFIQRNGEFTINIALISEGRPVFGVIVHPVTRTVFAACAHCGAWRKYLGGNWIRLSDSAAPGNNDTVYVLKSRSHAKNETDAYIKSILLKDRKIEIVELGSSLKFCRVSEIPMSIYPRLARTMEWDTAAGDIIVQEAGGIVINVGTNDLLKYGKKDRHNPSFIAKGNFYKI